MTIPVQLELAQLESGESSDPTCSEEDPGGRGPVEAGSNARWRFMRQGGVIPTAICLSKAAIGAGVLSMASHASETGLAFHLVSLSIGALLTFSSINMIGEAALVTRKWSFEDICDHLFHPALSLATGFVNASSCLGTAVAYLMVAGQVFQVLSGLGDGWRKGFIALVGVTVCLPLALARHVNFMRYLAMTSVLALVFLIISVAYALGASGPASPLDAKDLLIGPPGGTLYSYVNCLNIIVFAFNNQFNVPQLVGELDPQGQEQVRMVSMFSTAVAFSMYAAVSIVGVMAFGFHQKETLVLALAYHKGNPLVVCSLISVMFSVLMCFQFHIYPIRQFLAYCIMKLIKSCPTAWCFRSDATDGVADKALTQQRARRLDLACAIGTVLFAIVIALLLSTLRALLDFIGAFACAWISYVVPPMWILRIRQKSEDFQWYRLENCLCIGMWGLGVFFVVFGTFAAIHG